jgi:hypothetical protein
MLETLANLGEFVGGFAVVLSLIYVGFQLNETRKQMQASALQQRITARISTWSDQLDKQALNSARDKFFEYELYRRDETLDGIEELTQAERRALLRELAIELVYFQNVFYQRKHKTLDVEQSSPLDYMACFNKAPQRRHWKDTMRLNGHFPHDYVEHIDGIVKKYDEIERRMAEDEDADFSSQFQEVFKIPPPPNWLDS